MRFAVKFGTSLAITTPFPSTVSANERSVSSTARSVSGVGMISSRCR